MDSIVDYSRQNAFDEELNTDKQALNLIIGCGGVGFWLGLFLAMNGHTNFILMDGDKLDQTNLNRIPVPPTWLGTNKAVALRKLIRTVRPITNIVAYTAHITEDTLSVISAFHIQRGRSNTIVWDTTDNALIQTKINKFVSNLDTVQYRKIGYEAWDVGCYKNYDIWVNEATYAPGYQTSRANAVTSAFAAGLGYFAQGLNIQHDVTLNVKSALYQDRSLLIRAKNALLQGADLDLAERTILINDINKEC